MSSFRTEHDSLGEVRVPAHEATYDQVDVRSVPGPKGPERTFIACDRTAYEERLVFHVRNIGHHEDRKRFP